MIGNITFESITNGLSNIWGYIKSPIESTKNAIEFIKTETKKLYDKLLVLTGYEKAKGTSYVGTNLSLSAVDPAGKVLKLAGAGFFGRLNRMTDSQIFNAIKNIRVDSNARKHILDGEPGNKGGHRYGTGRPGKSEFPQNWSDEKIINTINEIINNPDSIKVIQSHGNIKITNIKDGINISVIVDPRTNKVITAFPNNTHRNP